MPFKKIKWHLFYYLLLFSTFIYYVVIEYKFSENLALYHGLISAYVIFSLYPLIIHLLRKSFCVFTSYNAKLFLTAFALNFFVLVNNIAVSLLHHFHYFSSYLCLFSLINVVLAIFYLLVKVCRIDLFQLIENDKVLISTLLLGSDNLKSSNKICNVFFVLIGFLFFVLSICYLELYNQHYYFTNDDNLSQFLPVILQSCRSFFVDGILPEINPYKYMGSPTAAAGVYSLTYPITYLSYAFSKFVLKQEYATIDVFCIFHLALAYFTAYFAAKVNHVKTSLCMVFALFYSLSGFSLVAVRSWYYMTPITAFAPLFVISLNYLKEKGVNFKWIILTGCLIGVTAYAGNIQMLAYMCLFFILAVVIFFLTQTINKFNFMSSFLPFILGAAIAFPLIFVSLDLLKDVVRNHGNTDSICYEYFYTMFVPYFALPNKDFTLAESFLNNYGQFFYSGSLFVIISFMGVFFAVVTPKRDGFSWSSLVSCNIYILLGLIALILSFGDYGLLWNILHSLPFFNKFICPEKMMLFINLFLNLGGVIILNRFFAKRKGHLEKGLLLFLLIVLFLHLKYSTQAFFKYDVYPYPDFGQIERAIPDIKQHRIYSVSPRRSESKSYLFALNNDIPSVSGIMSVCGYDSKLEDILPENLGLYTILCSDNSAYDSEKASSAFLINYLGQMGVKYVIYMESESQLAKSFPSSDYKLVYELDNIKYYSLKNYYPLSYIEVSKKTLPILYNSKGAVVDASEVEAGQSVIINMIWHKNYKAYAGNKEVPVHRDSYGRIRIILPEKVEKIVLKYTSPWGVGFIISLILFILFIISLIVYKLKNK